MKYIPLVLLLCSGWAAASCHLDNNLLDRISVQQQGSTKTAAQLGFHITHFLNEHYCLLLKQDNEREIALLYNKNNQSHILLDNFEKIRTSPDEQTVAVFTSRPYAGAQAGQKLYFFDKNGTIDMAGYLSDRVNPEQFTMYFTADSKTMILMTHDDDTDFYYAADLNNKTITKNTSLGTVREDLRQYPGYLKSFEVIDNDEAFAITPDYTFRYYKNGTLLWQKKVTKDRKDKTIAIGNKYVVTVTTAESIHFFSRKDGTEYKIMLNRIPEFSLHERLDPNNVRWVSDNKLVAMFSFGAQDRVFYFDFDTLSVTEDKTP